MRYTAPRSFYWQANRNVDEHTIGDEVRFRSDWLEALLRIWRLVSNGARDERHRAPEVVLRLLALLPQPRTLPERLALTGLHAELGLLPARASRTSHMRDGADASPASIGQAPSAEMLLAAQVKARIDHDCSKTLTVKALSRALGADRDAVNRAFKAAFSLTVHQYVVQVRIRAAARLLLATNQKTEHVHELVGFRSRTAFYKQFRRVIGCPPAAFRRTRRTASENEHN